MCDVVTMERHAHAGASSNLLMHHRQRNTSVVASGSPETSGSKASLASELSRLFELHQAGALDASEFARGKQAVMDSFASAGHDRHATVSMMAANASSASSPLGALPPRTGRLGYWWSATTWMERLGFPKDHHFDWHEQWLRHEDDPGRLRDEIYNVCETHLVFGTLMLGVNMTAYTEGLTSDEHSVVRDLHVGTFAFWANIFGVLAIFFCFSQICATYMMKMLIVPISDANLCAFMASRFGTDASWMCAFLMTFTLYATLPFYGLLFITLTDNSLLMGGIFLVAMSMIMGVALYYFALPSAAGGTRTELSRRRVAQPPPENAVLAFISPQ